MTNRLVKLLNSEVNFNNFNYLVERSESVLRFRSTLFERIVVFGVALFFLSFLVFGFWAVFFTPRPASLPASWCYLALVGLVMLTTNALRQSLYLNAPFEMVIRFREGVYYLRRNHLLLVSTDNGPLSDIKEIGFCRWRNSFGVAYQVVLLWRARGPFRPPFILLDRKTSADAAEALARQYAVSCGVPYAGTMRPPWLGR